ncbi:DUF6318 family protein [Arthrobacter sp. StoSoilB13]|uniref:DUF6318 family protein n=1 Tax=Arthrobacter sp. StoSoilB13 TaxID=2830993 RepID=UPI001CC701A0|nr:DUF6318 family protein [Arthrobacter sp. StoSoilB13]BCW52058.1 hypothetical protein StoSoilB13_44000 [Arthrobacter sp. StoSoilB13]
MPRLSFASFTVLIVRVAAAALGVSLLLTGCQGGSPPGKPSSETGPTTASPTSGASGSPSAAGSSATTAPSGVYKPANAKGKAQNVPVPVMPELAKENTKEGLEAFIRYWYAQLSYVDETGDMSSWLPLISRDCRLCIRLQESGEDGYTKGRWLAGGKISVPVVEVQWGAENGGPWAKVQVVQEAINYYNADGTAGRASDEQSNDAFAFFAKFADDKWTVVDLGLLS